MKVGYVQFRPVFGDKKRNVERALKLLGEGARRGAELLVLPELFETGYVFRDREELARLAEEIPDGHIAQTLGVFAEEHGLFIGAGVCERSREGFYDSALLVGPEGFVGKYRKAHLFKDEKKWFTPGDTELAVYDVGGVKVGLMICFDWAFPEVPRLLALKGAEILCHPSNLMLPYCQTAMLGVAVQNRIFIITSNRVGVERGVKFTGRSQIVGPDMKVLARSRLREEVRVVEIDPSQARNKKITTANDLFRDRRLDLYPDLKGV